MGFINEYPYTDFHELNLDYLLNKTKELDTKVNDMFSEKLDEAIDKYFNSIFINAIYNEATETITLRKEIIAGEGVHVYDAENDAMIIE